jgi:uncharacterized protein
MRIYAAADIHGRKKKLEKIRYNIEKNRCAILVLAGDICDRKDMERIMDFINDMPVPVFAVRGNVDHASMVDMADSCSNINLLHRRSLDVNGVSFVGVSGTVSVPFRSRIGIRESETAEKVSLLVSRETILIAHPPPWGVLDKAFGIFHSGSLTIEAIVVEKQPRVLICGHIHEGRGFAMLGQTVVVNSALGKDGEGSIVDLNDGGTPEISML